MPKIPFWVFILIAILYFTAARVDTMDIDASQYAEISREMLKSGDLIHVYDRGLDYLDKPPFLFWVSSASMRVFGINNFGYKFPSILFALWALFATYRLAKLLYNDATGRMAALILATCQGMFLMTNDVRCDTILMSCVISAIWLIKEWYARCRLPYLLMGFFFIGIGMMTKGPIALMVPVFCFSTDWALKREWRNFFRPAYFLGLVIIAIVLLPMSIGLYQQFDMQPGKIVNGTKGVSGLRFFYWTQSFGRITGESPWKNDVNLGFLLQNMLWSYLPWIFLFLPALVLNIIQLARQRFRLQPQQEWITTGGFILSYLALGSSAYQLPHYIFVVFPLASIITAHLLHQLIEENSYKKLYAFMRPFMGVVSAVILLIILVFITYVFPGGVWMVMAWVACFALWLFIAFRKNLPSKILWLPAAGMFIANIFLTNHFYPTLLRYQVGSQAGRFIRSSGIPTDQVTTYKMEDPLNALDFYANGIIRNRDAVDGFKPPAYILTMDSGLSDLKAKGYTYNIEQQGDLFKVSELTPEFLNPVTRNASVRKYYLIKIK